MFASVLFLSRFSFCRRRRIIHVSVIADPEIAEVSSDPIIPRILSTVYVTVSAVDGEGHDGVGVEGHDGVGASGVG